jgi:hypothetical protein
MKYFLITITLFINASIAHTQSFKISDLAVSVGNWEGKLTYLDYSTGNPFTMLANITISFTEDKKGYIMGYEYPKEPHANSKDTTYANNNFFGKEKIVEFNKDAHGGYRLVTEIDGQDGNDNKKAVLKHIYLLQSNSYSLTKEVKFEGTNKWIKRNEYIFVRK